MSTNIDIVIVHIPIEDNEPAMGPYVKDETLERLKVYLKQGYKIVGQSIPAYGDERKTPWIIYTLVREG